MITLELTNSEGSTQVKCDHITVNNEPQSTNTLVQCWKEGADQPFGSYSVQSFKIKIYE